jgi:6-phosphogluconolactonase
VPPDDERSNFGMARDALFDRLPGKVPDVRRIPGELGPDAGAAEYETALRAAFGEGIPRFDLVLLGLGPDGHCASLFPGDPALEERERLAVGVPRAGLAPWVPRVTLTLPVLNAARQVMFLVTGADKAAATARAFGGEPDPRIPASLVAPADGTLTVLTDRAAAAQLPISPRSAQG